ncbi:MAG: hypothetical protein ACYC3I_00760 [Gemmataceae bacterium]
MVNRSVGVLLLWALTAFSLQAQTRLPMTYGDIEIILQTVPQGISGHGYFEYAFRVRNLSKERPHTVTLSLPFQKGYRPGDSIGELRRTVQVGANETARLSLLQPDHPPIGGRDVAVFIDGQRRQREYPLTPLESQFSSRVGRIYYSLSRNTPLLLIGSHVGSLPKQTASGGMIGMGGGAPGMGGPGMPVVPKKPAPPPGGGRRTGGGAAPAADWEMFDLPPEQSALPCLGSLLEMVLAWETFDYDVAPGKPGLPAFSYQPVTPESVETWSSDWLAYSRYDGVLVTADELKAMPAGVRDALWQYVETGGFLLVVGPADPRGLSSVAEVETDPAGWKSVYAGFGECLISPDANYDKWDAEHFDLLHKAWTAASFVWPGGPRNTEAANNDFPIIEDLGIPIKGLLVLMFLFALGIGPANLLLLSHLKRRLWMLWTTPVFSICTCAAVFGYMLIAEGWQGQMRTETLTLLDESTHRATTIGWTGFYSPLTPSGGLHFSYQTEVITQHAAESLRGEARISCTIDLTQDQHFASGWVEARVPAHFKVRKSETRRERAVLQREPDGRWSMVNGLGAAIRRFWYADDKGQIHEAEDIAAGARTLLTRTDKECPVRTRTMRSILAGNWMSGIFQMTEYPRQYLRPGLYLAEMDDSPFLEDALREAKKRKAHAFIVGFHQPSD